VAKKEPRLQLKRIDHVAIVTEDLNDAERLWERNLGLKAEASSKVTDEGLQAVRLPIGDAFLELVQPLSGQGRFAGQLRERGEGLFSLAIEVDDLGAAIAYLRDRGITVSNAEADTLSGLKIARINHASSHGVPIELIERK